LAVRCVGNPEWKQGQGTSVRAGMARVPEETGSAVFLLADQPQVPASVIRGLVEMHALQLPPIVAPRVAGRTANPILFDRKTFCGLLALSGDTGGRALFAENEVAHLDWPDTELLLDVDTADDYRRLLDARK
jgi:molybdenum cofactor cytidylyltransferase